jgi:hypothetical protein
MNTYAYGSTVRISTTTVFTTGGVATDPTTVTLKVEQPDGTETTYTYAGGTVAKANTGSYYKDVQVSQHGTWTYKWIGTGAVAAVDEDSFHVLPTMFA